jgi:hypothetical protein
MMESRIPRTKTTTPTGAGLIGAITITIVAAVGVGTMVAIMVAVGVATVAATVVAVGVGILHKIHLHAV